MGIEIGCDSDPHGMMRALDGAVGSTFEWVSGSSETTCTFRSAPMPLQRAQAIVQFLHRIPKDVFFCHHSDFKVVNETTPPPASAPKGFFSQRVQTENAAPETTAQVEFHLPASSTISLRDLLTKFRFDERDYPQAMAAAKAMGR